MHAFLAQRLSPSCVNPKLIQCSEYIHILPLNNFGLTLIRNDVCLSKLSNA